MFSGELKERVSQDLLFHLSLPAYLLTHTYPVNILHQIKGAPTHYAVMTLPTKFSFVSCPFPSSKLSTFKQMSHCGIKDTNLPQFDSIHQSLTHIDHHSRTESTALRA